jgi:hypothetical protein
MDEKRIKEVEYMEQLLTHLDDPHYGKVLQNTLKSLSSTSGGKETVDSLFTSLSDQFKSDEQLNDFPLHSNDKESLENADRKIASTLNMLSRAQVGMEGFETNKIEETAETMMEDMMAEFENLGEKEDYNNVMNALILT